MSDAAGASVAEVQDPSESEAQAEPIETSAAAVALALGRTSRTNEALDEDARVFLREQTELVRLQKEHLHEQRSVVLSRQSLGRLKDLFSLSLQAMTAVIGVGVVILIGAMAWQAHSDHGLVVEAFSVPPDLARDGLTGQVVGARFLDKLQAMQSATQSDRPANTFTNNWGGDIKLEIPETGLTFGEFEKLLHDKLGHASHVTGEVYKTPAGVALTARLGDGSPKVFEGPEANLDALEQQAAEAVYRSSQPYRFAAYLEQHGRVDEAFQVISDLAVNGPLSERGWAYAQWSVFDLNDHGDLAAAKAHAQRAITMGGDASLTAEISLVNEETWAGHDQAALDVSRILELRAQRPTPGTTNLYFQENRLVSIAWLATLTGDHRSAAEEWMRAARTPDYMNMAVLAPALAATDYEMDHDPRSAREAMTLSGGASDASLMPANAIWAFNALPGYWAAAEAGDWAGALAHARATDAWLEQNASGLKVYNLMRQTWIQPLEALAQARTGDVAGATALIMTTPADCYLCVRVRGLIAAQARDWTTAARWFEEAARQAPALPFAYSDWGGMLLAKGDLDGALAKFARAHATSPHFADPEELRGEALVRKGDVPGAAEAFAAADKDAPRWGRNHLLWGEALARLGRRDEARAQFDVAAGLELAADDRAELAKARGGLG